MEADRPSVNADTVFQALQAALSFENTVRGPAEAQLREWEADAVPGFIGSLLKVVSEVNAVPEVSAQCMYEPPIRPDGARGRDLALGRPGVGAPPLPLPLPCRAAPSRESVPVGVCRRPG